MANIKSIADLTPDPKNARKHNSRNIGQIEKSLRKYGAARSIVIDETNQIIAGHGVIEAAAQAGIERVQVVDVDGETIVAVRRTGLTKKQKQELGIADNRAGDLSEWDGDMLAELMGDIDLDQFFTKDELAELVPASVAPIEDVEPQVDRAEELRVKWGVESGQLWQLGDHRLICGDCTDRAVVERVMDGERADAVVTDPPYGQDQPGVTNDSPDKLVGIVRGSVAALPVDDAVVIAFGSPRTFPEWLDSVRDNGHKFERMLWLYKAAQMAKPWRGWLLTSEAILVSSVGSGNWTDVHPYSHDCYYKSEVSGQLPENSGWHGSVKPLDVVVDLVSRVCAPGSIVYEPFSGSGTTLIACERLGRKCRAIEIDPGYVAVALERWATATGKTPMMVNDD